MNQRCQCTDPHQPSPNPSQAPLLSDVNAALAVADTVAELEVNGDVSDLYRSLHPDAQAIIPREAVVGWYENEFTQFGQPAPKATKVRFIPWTWDVTGRTYPNTAEVALRQDFPDGRIVRDEIRLVKDRNGNWGWFFGRTRPFVDEQIDRFVPLDPDTVTYQPGEACTSTRDCSQAFGPTQCVRELRDGVTQIICLREPGGGCQSAEDCNQAGGSVTCGKKPRGGVRAPVCLREEGGPCKSDRGCANDLTCDGGVCGRP